MRTRYIEARCDRCGHTQSYEELRAFQSDGWLSIDWRAIGVAQDHSSVKSNEICHRCMREFLHFLDGVPVAQKAKL